MGGVVDVGRVAAAASHGGLWWRVLGPVRLEGFGGRGEDDGVVDPGPGKQRAILAALLLTPGRVVPAETLIARVWEDRPPGGRNPVAPYVTRLRQVLTAAAPNGEVGVLRHSHGGYVFDCDPDRVDLHRARRIAGEARAARACGDERGAVDLLQQALAGWQRTTLVGVSGAWADRIRDLLHRERVDLLTQRAELNLGLGRFGDVVDELRPVVADEPAAETLVGPLLIALARTGRTTEALECYAGLRRTLAEQLGSEPSQPLRDLHVRILRGDFPTTGDDISTPLEPNGAPAAMATATSIVGDDAGATALTAPGQLSVTVLDAPLPAQLPTTLPSFVGREAELARLDAVLAATDGPVEATIPLIVTGPPGVGKTTLALHWVHRVASRFPDGQLYVNMRGFDVTGSTLAPAEALRGFLEALGVLPSRIPTDVDARAALYRSLLTGRRMLILVDNARDPDQVRPLLPGTPGCLVLVTSRDALSGLVTSHGAAAIMVDVMRPAEARQLLANRLGQERLDAEPEAVDEITVRCARLPLALAIAAARAAARPHFPLAALTQQMRDTRNELDAFTAGEASTDIRAVFSWSYHTLTPEAATLFRLLGLHPGPDFALPAAASLAGLPQRSVRALLDELTRAHLINEHTPGRYSFHDLLRVYANEQAHTSDSPAQRDLARRRLLDHYLHTSHAVEARLRPSREALDLPPPGAGVTIVEFADLAAMVAWYDAEQQVLLAAARQAADLGLDRQCWQLAWTLTDFLNKQGRHEQLASIQRVALDAARRLGDPHGQALIHRSLARAYAELGHFDQAESHLHDAIRLLAATGNRAGEAYAASNLGSVYALAGRHQEALRQTAIAIDMFRDAGSQSELATVLNNASWVSANLGDFSAAFAYCQEARGIARCIGLPDLEASTNDTLGFIHHRIGHYRDAIAHYQRALAGFRKLGGQSQIGNTLARLGDTHHALGDHKTAARTWQQAIDILDTIGHPTDRIRAKLRNHHSTAEPTGPQRADAGVAH
jgi:tetratricopeptide (TPR) repeat protein/DNA-binding SARP family transcriptional activator